MKTARRCGVIDVGTNSVLLLVAQRDANGELIALRERAEITRLGKGVDQSRRLADDSVERTLAVLREYVDEAKALGAEEVFGTATSAARDASNGAAFLERAWSEAGVRLEILSGDDEARFSFDSVAMDPALSTGASSLVVIDIGGGSTELIYGNVGKSGAPPAIHFKHSFDVGSVRLFERFVRSDPPSPTERKAATDFLGSTFAALPPPPAEARWVGVAGTVTTALALVRKVDPYDASRIHGQVLERSELATLVDRLFSLPVAERQRLPGLQPKRADVIPLGALILQQAMERHGVDRCWVSDRGLRWGVLRHRFTAGG